MLDITTWQRFAPEQLDCGGLGPHLKMMAGMAGSFGDWRERAWFLGCYIGPYIPTSGYVIWQRHPEPTFVQAEALEGLPVRKSDRRAVASKVKLATFLQSYAKWIDTVSLPDVESYDALWDSAAKHLRYAGRFTIIKLMEGLRLAGVTTHELTSGIQPAGAQSGPRRALQAIARSAGIECDLLTGNRPEKLAEVNRAARWAESLLVDVRPLTWFELEGMLCDARQAVRGRYPGRALDEDLEYHLQIGVEWPGFYEWRRHLFPEYALGEVGGWSGRREEKEKEWTQ